VIRILAACCLCLALVAEDAPRPSLGISVDTGAIEEGLPVLSVIPGGAADRMGLKVGDRILQVNGKRATNDDLRNLVRTAKIGDTVALQVRRGTETIPLSGPLTERPAPRNIPNEIQALRDSVRQMSGGAGAKPTLAEILATLQEIERDLPRAAAEFKAIYPNGEFDIDIRIRIVSDKTAAAPVDLTPARLSATAATTAVSATAPVVP
jgi:hypothetical protein